MLASSKDAALCRETDSSCPDTSFARTSTLSIYSRADFPATPTRSNAAISDLICNWALFPAPPIWLVTSFAALVTTGRCLRSCSRLLVAALLTASSVFAFSSLSTKAAVKSLAASTMFPDDCLPTVSNSRAFCARNSRASDISSLTVRIRASSASLSVLSASATLPKRVASARLCRIASSQITASNNTGVAHMLTSVTTRSPAIPPFTSAKYVQPKKLVHANAPNINSDGMI